MNLGIVVLEYARAIRGEKIHWRDNLVIQYIQELCWLAVPRPDQLKQPQIIILQFSDLKLSKFYFVNFFFARQCIIQVLLQHDADYAPFYEHKAIVYAFVHLKLRIYY